MPSTVGNWNIRLAGAADWGARECNPRLAAHALYDGLLEGCTVHLLWHWVARIKATAKTMHEGGQIEGEQGLPWSPYRGQWRHRDGVHALRVLHHLTHENEVRGRTTETENIRGGREQV